MHEKHHQVVFPSHNTQWPIIRRLTWPLMKNYIETSKVFQVVSNCHLGYNKFQCDYQLFSEHYLVLITKSNQQID